MTPPDPVDLQRLRADYPPDCALAEDGLATCWLAQFQQWLAAAVAAGEPEANAMVLATADAGGRPSARTVLLKDVDETGFVFYTNLGSRKATDLRANPYASLVFRWLSLHRQVVVSGSVLALSRAATEAYFARRPRSTQLGAWASPQSQVIQSRAELDRRYAEAAARFAGSDPVPAPPHWGGLRVVPESVEFWQGRPDRLHDRLRYRRVRPGLGITDWAVERLAP